MVDAVRQNVEGHIGCGLDDLCIREFRSTSGAKFSLTQFGFPRGDGGVKLSDAVHNCVSRSGYSLLRLAAIHPLNQNTCHSTRTT